MARVSVLTLPIASQNFGRDMTEVHRPQCSTPMLLPILRQDRNCGGITQPPSTVSSKTIEFYKPFFGFSISDAAGSVAGVVLISRPRGGHAITVLQTVGHDPVYRRVRASMIAC